MLRVIGHTPVESEQIKSDYYVVSVLWNHTFPRFHIWWRTGDFRRALLEIGFNEQTHTLESIRIVNILKDWVSPSEIVDFNPDLPIETGLPIFDWTRDRPSPMLVNETGKFSAHIASDHVSLVLGSDSRIVSGLQANRTLFGLDEHKTLVAAQFTNLLPQEILSIKRALIQNP